MVKKTRGRYNVVREVRNERVLEKYSADGMSKQIVHWCNDDDDDDDKDTLDWASYWAANDFSPDSTGAENVAALNTALDAFGTVKIVTAGIYDFDGTIWIPSDTTLEICEGVTFRKETGSVYSHIIGNKGIKTNTRDYNIKIYGNGLILDMNGIDAWTFDESINPIFRLRSLLELWKVTNFEVDGIYANNMDMLLQFFFSMAGCTDGEISNIDQISTKNSINFIGGCKRITLTNIKMSGEDDDYFIGIGYPNGCPYYGDCEDITIINHTCNQPEAIAGGNIARIWGGSWGDWSSGMTTHDQEAVVASNGLVYARGWNTGGDIVSTIEPTHTNINEHPVDGEGIEWWLMETEGESIYSSSVRRITFKNIVLNKMVPCFQFWHNYVTAGTEGTYVIEDIIIDNLTIPENYTKYIFEQRARGVDVVTVKNTTINSWVDATGTGLMQYPNSTYILSVNKLVIDNCNITIPTVNNKFVYMAVENAILGEIEIKNSSISMPSALVIIGGVNTTTFGKLTITDSIIDCNNGNLILYGRGQLAGDNTIFTRTTFISVARLVYLSVQDDAVNLTQRYIDCIFQTALSYMVVNTTPNYIVNIIMAGTTFIDPAQYLFYTNQGNGSIVIDISDSSGSVTPAKVRNSSQVTVTACDLEYV